MKKYIIFLLIAGIGFSACTEELELEPAQSISENQALNSDGNVKAVLIGAYDALATGDLYGGNVLRNSELLGGDGEIQWVGTFNSPREIFNKNMIASNSDASEVWLDGFNTINIANNVLDALSVVDAEDQPRVEGEALFIRAAVYFELVRFYGKQFQAGGANDQAAVPLVLTPTRAINEETSVSRASVGQIYSQIISDLNRAGALLPESNGVFANKGAVNALLARVYLQQSDFSNALTAANAVIASGIYSLVPSYANAFNQDNNTVETIFGIQITSQDGANNMNTFFSIPDFGGRDGDIDILDGHLDLYDPADERLGLFYEGNGAIRSGKWNNQFGNISIFRLAEMHLIRAEANIRLGGATGASPLDDYNAIRARAGLAPATEVSLEDILLERRLELAHEGFKIHDMRRLGESIGTLPADADNVVFPVPQREINANPNLTQNPGY